MNGMAILALKLKIHEPSTTSSGNHCDYWQELASSTMLGTRLI